MNIGEIDTSEYEGMLGWLDIDKDEEEWRLEIDINGYKAVIAWERVSTVQMRSLTSCTSGFVKMAVIKATYRAGLIVTNFQALR